MRKIVINDCYGGFGISVEALQRLLELGVSKPKDEYMLKDDETLTYYVGNSLERDDPRLVQVVEELGKQASGDHAELKIVSIPDKVKWEIHDYDGMESVHEQHRSWS